MTIKERKDVPGNKESDVKRLLLLCALLTATAANAAQTELKNWFNDPFFPVRQGIPHCPPPLGPLVSEAEMKKESHWRVERGTSCWLAGKCARPNAYYYDADIAKAIQARFSTDEAFNDSSLWITVQRRFVWVEGCVADRAEVPALEATLKALPDVEMVIVNVTRGTSEAPKYRVAPTP